MQRYLVAAAWPTLRTESRLQPGGYPRSGLWSEHARLVAGRGSVRPGTGPHGRTDSYFREEGDCEFSGKPR